MHNPLIYFSVVLALGIAAQWLAWRLKLPSILLLLAFGFLIGVVGGDDPSLEGSTLTDEVIPAHILFSAVSLAVAVVLFEGGLTLRLHELERSGRVVFRLVTIGVLVTWVLTAFACGWLLPMEPRVAALAGSILVVTGPTVIGPLLHHVRPSRRVSSLLKWESIVIDPIGAVLAVLVFEAVAIGEPYSSLVALGRIILVGIFLGVGTAFLLVQVMRRYWVPDFLHNPVFLAAAVGAFALSNQLAPEAGLVTVTVLGVALANQRTVPVRHVLEFKENLRVLLISCLFIVLASRIRPQDVIALGWGGIAVVVLGIVLIRPISVWLATLGSEITFAERWFASFLAPRGIVAASVSSVFALELSRHFHDGQMPLGGDKIVPLTFLVIVGTVIIYGLAAAPLAQRLNLAVANPQGILFAGAGSWIRAIAKALQDEGIHVLLVDTNYENVSSARMAGLPSRCASIVSEYMEEIELAGIGRMLAMTPNDNLNTLAAIEFAQLFGRAEVYQLYPGDMAAKRREATSPHMHGRYLFSREATFGTLSFQIAAGAQIKKTKITTEFTYADFLARYGDSAIVLFVLTEQRNLQVATVEKPLFPEPGQTVVALISRQPDEIDVLDEAANR